MSITRMRVHVTLLAVVALWCAIAVLGCQRRGPAPEPKLPPPAPRSGPGGHSDTHEQPPVQLPQQEGRLSPAVVSANTDFGFKLFAELCGEDLPKNVVISPLSLATVLSMTYNGAAGETKQAMAETLEFAGLSLQEINDNSAHLIRDLNAQDAVEVALANSVWIRQGVRFGERFLRTNEQYYQATARELDFDAREAVDIINAWVGENTKGRIDEILDEPIHKLTTMFLINAAYFMGEWAKKFDESHTRDGAFTLLDGTRKTVPMMWRGAEYDYLRTDEVQAIRLPYTGGRLSMYVILPSATDGLDAVCRSMGADRWEALLGRLSAAEVGLSLPRFRVAYEAELREALSVLGMVVAFDPNRADFANMVPTPRQIWIEEVKHKTFVEVTEKGTEAAATSVVEMMEGEEELGPEQMTVDHPFLCAIRDDETGSLLFLGAITDPS